MELTLLEVNDSALRAGFSCPCGCTPSVVYVRDTRVVEEGCCCGNQFAVGQDAATTLSPRAGFRAERQAFDTPWGERLEAAWLVGPSVHEAEGEHGHDHGSDVHAAMASTQAIDPVCAMTIEPDAARAKGLNTTHQGVDYYFCGKGCRLDFEEEPERYLDPGYVPSM